jgi:tRNA(fMet)-specific endonuclease VapC
VSRFLLDTSIVSAPMWKAPNPRVLGHLEAHAASSAIASPVWHELLFGCRRLPRGKRRSALEAYLEEVVRATLPILPYDEPAAAWHAAERARLEAAGKAAPFVDGQIAAIAATRELTLATANVADFRSFRGLTVVDWSRA